MNPMTNIKNVIKMNDRELEMGIAGTKSSWHHDYKDSAWIFLGGMPYDLTEGDLLAVFSQYGEIVHINLVRDHTSGKSKGFGFICYEDQRSTILAVDNLNGFKLLGRTIRVDHVQTYKLPKDLEKMDQDRKKLFLEGCAPKAIEQEEEEDSSSSSEEEEEEKSKKKKRKKEKKSKKSSKKKKKTREKSESDDDRGTNDGRSKERDRGTYDDRSRDRDRGTYDDRSKDRNRDQGREDPSKERERGTYDSRRDRESRDRRRKSRSRSPQDSRRDHRNRREDRSRSRERRRDRR